MEVYYEWHTQNVDVPYLNDKSTLKYSDGVLTVGCNDDTQSYKVTGPEPTVEDFHKVEEAHGDEPVCPDDPRYVLKTLGLETQD